MSKDRPIRVEWATATAPSTPVVDLPVLVRGARRRMPILKLRAALWNMESVRRELVDSDGGDEFRFFPLATQPPATQPG